MPEVLLDLVILRHGEAEPLIQSDELRNLTERGGMVVSQQAKKLQAMDFQPEHIVHSPFARTTQTAQICHKQFFNADIRSDSALLQSAEPSLVPLVWHGSESVLLVSHMPLVGRLIQYLCPNTEIYGLPVAGFVRLNVTQQDLHAVLQYDGRNV